MTAHDLLTEILREKDMVTFKVASVSSNRNSFGLHGVILMANTGESYEAGFSPYGYRKMLRKGDLVSIERHGKSLDWSSGGFEIVKSLGIAPMAVVKEVWNEGEN